MGLFSRWKKKNPDSKQFRREMVLSVNGRHIRYVTEKRNGVDEVIGRNGNLNIHEDCLLVYASSDVIFRCGFLAFVRENEWEHLTVLANAGKTEVAYPWAKGQIDLLSGKEYAGIVRTGEVLILTESMNHRKGE